MFFQLFFTAIKCIFSDLFTDRNDIFLCPFIFFNYRNEEIATLSFYQNPD